MIHRIYCLPLLASLLFASLAAAKTPIEIYLRYDNACMDRLEYERPALPESKAFVAYRYIINSAESLVMEVGSESTQSLPKEPLNTLRCHAFLLSEESVMRIARKDVKIFMVRPTDQGFNVSPVNFAYILLNHTDRIVYKDPNVEFTVKHNDFNGTNNLALYNDTHEIFYMGSREYSTCATAYDVRKDPLNTCDPHTDLSIVPQMGAVKMSSWLDKADEGQNTLLLVRVNGYPVGEFIAEQCTNGIRPADPYLEKYKELQRAKSYDIAYQEPGKRSRAADDSDFLSKGDGNSGNTPETKAETKPSEAGKSSTEAKPCDKSPKDGTHIVQDGETLYRIALKYRVQVPQLVAWNNFASDRHTLYPCDEIRVSAAPAPAPAPSSYDQPEKLSAKSPAEAPQKPTSNSSKPCNKTAAEGIHIVEDGESLYRIALKYRIKVSQLVAWNNFASEKHTLYPCDEVRISPPAEAPQSPDSSASLVAKSGEMQPKPLNPCNKTVAEGTHIVEDGESLYRIALKYRVKVSQLVTWNNFASEKHILYPCDEVRISPPSSSPAESSAPAEKPAETGSTPAGNFDPALLGVDYHSVQDGETLASIAQRYGYTPQRLMHMNQLGSEAVSVGQRLRVKDAGSPASTPRPDSYDKLNPKGGEGQQGSQRTHIVQDGETLYRIALRYNTSMNRLAALNGFNSTDQKLMVGQRLLLP